MTAEVTGEHHDAGRTCRARTGAARDPVCGMTVDPIGAKHTAEHAGRNWYFCSARCRERFGAEPAKYLAGRPRCPRWRRPAPSTPAPCIRKFAKSVPASARYAAWRSSPPKSWQTAAPTLSSST